MSHAVGLIRIASGSKVKREAVEAALAQMRLEDRYEIEMCPVDLPDAGTVNEQPEGYAETEGYARARLVAMCQRFGANSDAIDIAIESGAIGGEDVAIVLLAHKGTTQIGTSIGVPFPKGLLGEARRRGFKTTTVGHVMHEYFPGIPADNWHHTMVPGMTRQKQIGMTLVPLLRGAIQF